jgi:predicted  nucleic acid-binding Zn-ribbon protein
MVVDSPVETALSQLAALQEIDRQRREKTEQLQVLQAEVAECESALERQRAATGSLQAERNALESRRLEVEAHLEAEETKMKDRRMRLNRVRNEKELQALRREIEVGKEANQQTEEELLGILEALEKLTTEAADAERALMEMEAATAAKITEHKAHIDRLVAEIAQDREIRDRTADALDASLLQKYEQIFERRGGTAVVEVRNGTCLGCHMHVPPQFFNELQRTREVRLCPNCHRILFWRPERLEPAVPER